ncbi:MAG: alpha/beta fold hydrolase [Panacagrimonas sp.]
MSTSRSDFLSVNGLRYHVRRWGPDDAPKLFMAHGWMDVSATFEPVARRLAPQFQVLMPDWRGFGETERAPGGYWFPDYVSDLDIIIDHYAPGAAVFLAGHSMGAQVVSLYAGSRPQRVSRLAILDGLFLPDGSLEQVPQRYAKWLDHLRALPPAPSYDSFAELARRVLKRHPGLDAARSEFITRCWGRQDADGRVRLRSDPRHLLEAPRPYRQDEASALWSAVTAQTRFIDGGASGFRNGLPAEERDRRRAHFRHHSVTVIPDAGHMLHFDVPERLAEELLRFFSA